MTDEVSVLRVVVLAVLGQVAYELFRIRQGQPINYLRLVCGAILAVVVSWVLFDSLVSLHVPLRFAGASAAVIGGMGFEGVNLLRENFKRVVDKVFGVFGRRR